jgi:hypothetical protein
MWSILWGIALIVAVVWPGRLVGPLDGVPFDAPHEALLLAAVLTVLWFLAPAFLRTRTARALIGTLLVWKVAGWLLLTQSGLCATFLAAPQPDMPMQTQPSWDARTLWSPRGGCSAILTRPYLAFEGFPAWMINILPEAARPPGGTFGLRASGVVVTRADAPLRMSGGAGARPSGEIDGRAIGPADWPVSLAPGVHRVDVSIALRGTSWQFVPRLGDSVLFDAADTFVTRPTVVDRAVGRWARWITPGIVTALLVMWTAFAFRALQPTVAMVGWAAAASMAAFALGVFVQPPVVRFTMLGLLPAAFLAVPERSRTLRSAFLLVALPWLAFFAGRSLHDVGHFVVYTSGDDWWTFQRHAYEIFMQRLWFEGGEKTFWNQPLYRWTAGALHLIFGDSSAGEMYLDAAGVAVGAMFAFAAVSRLTSFRVGVLAAVLVLNVSMLGPNWYGIGRGLSEISAAMCVYLAAFALRRTDGRAWKNALVAGLCAMLAFFTRLNQLVLLASMLLLLIPEAVEAGSAFRVRDIWRRLPKAAGAIYLSCIVLAVLAITTRTWFYTGRFSLFFGTQRDLVSTGLGLSTIFSKAAWGHALESVAMIVTVQDPPRLDPRVVIVTIGAACAVLGLLAVPVVRRLPLGLAVFCVGAFAGGLLVRGSGYAGRFSVQLIPVGTAVAVTSLALALGPRSQHGEVHHE